METFKIFGMKCEENCAKRVSQCAQEVPGVTNVSLDYLKKLLHVTYDSHVDPTIIEKIAMCIESAGYSVEWGHGSHIQYYKIDGMYCNHCVGTVEKAIQSIPGVHNVIVNLDKHIATVIVDPSCKSDELIEAISSVGYDATPYEGSRDIYLHIEGMACEKFCANALHNALRKVDGVACVKVDFNQSQAVVRGSAKFEDLAAAVEQAGFSAKSGVPGTEQSASCCQSEKDSKFSFRSTNKIEAPNSGADSRKLTNLQNSRNTIGSLADNQTMFEVKGMSCGSCVSAIERLLLSHPGVEQASVALLTEKAHVVYDSTQVSWQTLLAAIENAGYRAKHLSTRRNDNSDCRQRIFLIEASRSTSGKIQSTFNGLNSLLGTAGVLDTKWVEIPAPTNGLEKIGLEVTYDPAVVGLRCILESITVSNPQFTVSLSKKNNDTVDTFTSQKRALDELWNELVIAVCFSAPLSLIMWAGIFMEEIVSGLTWMDIIAIILSTLCQFISGQRFYQEAYRGIQTRALGMGFLVALGTTCAYFFGLFSIMHSVATKGDVTSYPDNLMTSTMLITFVLLGKYLEARAKTYTSVALKKLLDHQPATAILLSTKPNHSRDGSEGVDLVDDGECDYFVESERVVSTDLLEENDIVKVVRGMTIPVDGEIIHGAGEVNEALITGEAMPVNKSVHDDVIGGTQLQEGILHVRVRAVPENSVLQQIIKLVENAQMEKAPIQQMADQIAGVFALFVISISVVVFILWFTLLKFEMISREYLPPNLSDFVIAFTFSISSLVVACPCAMGLATPTAIMVGTGVGAKIGILIKGGEALETANKLTTIVFDKTGTLTMGCPEVSNIYLLSSSGSKMVLVDGHQEDGVAAVNHHIHNPLFETITSSSLTDSPPADQRNAAQQQVRVSCVPCIDTAQSHEFMDENGLLWMVASAEINSEHVIGRAIVRYATSNPNLPPLENSVDMNATTGRGIKCMVKGYEVLVGSLKYLREEGVEHSQNSTFQNMSIAAEDVGSIVVFAAINGSMRAMIQLTDKPRPEARATIQRLHEMGKKVWMVTGDNIRTARSIALAVGIPAMQVISEALPSTKIQHVTNLQEEGEFVGFVGDGINDAPAVAKADVGIAMGGGTDVAMESADMVLMRADVFSVVVAIDLSHAILQCIRRNLFWALAYNVVAIPIAAGLSLSIFHAIIPPWVAGGAMALSSVSVVLSSLSLRYYQPPVKHTRTSSSSGSSPLTTLTRSSSKSPPTALESPFPSRLTSFGDKLLSFADGFEYLEMDEGKALIDDKPKKLYGSDNRV